MRSPAVLAVIVVVGCHEPVERKHERPREDAMPEPVSSPPPITDSSPPPPPIPPSTPTALVEREGAPHGIALDATHVYWTAAASGAVGRIAKGGASVEYLAMGEALPWSIVLDTKDVYFVTRGSKLIRKVGKNERQAYTLVEAAEEPWTLALGADWLVWTSDHFVQGAALAHGGKAAGSIHGRVMTLDGRDMIVATKAPCEIERHPGFAGFAGRPRVRLCGCVGEPSAIASDANDYFVAIRDTGVVLAIAKSSGAVRTLLSHLAGPEALAVDETHVFVTDRAGGRVVSIPKTGGPSKVIASAQGKPEGIAVDERAVYWVNFGDGRVMWVAK